MNHIRLAASAFVVFFSACSSGHGGGPAGSAGAGGGGGGAVGSAGSTGAGGSSGASGSAGRGGAVGSAGSTGTGGSTSAGGAVGAGGSTGGAVGAAGSTGAGGSSGASGSAGRGGAGGSGGSAGGGSSGAGGGFTCSTGRVLCGTECVDTTADPRYCGSCSHPCGANQVCASSACQTSSDCRQTPCTGFSYCDLSNGQCKPGCAFDTQCSANETCDLTSHACVCKAMFHRCSGVCTSDTSVASCGTSCTACATSTNGTTTCAAGACKLTCDTGYRICPGGTQCLSNTSLATCGPSCAVCPTVANGTATCDGTACGFTCATNYRACGGVCAACPTANATAFTCSGTTCVASTCQSPYRVCNGTCQLSTSVTACGTSCRVCPTVANGTPTCDGTSCGISCNTGSRLCSGVCALCPTGAATAATTACASSTSTTCIATSCASGNHLCSGQCPVNTSLQACGTQNCVACPASPASGTATCDGTLCGVTCGGGNVRCDSNACCADCRLMSGACTGYAWCGAANGVCSAVQKIEASDATATNRFGISVSLDGTTLAVGRTDTSGGSVQFVERQSDGNWLVTANKVTAGSHAVSGSGFGAAVALSGDRLVVGAAGEGPNSTGAAYVFERPGPGGAWAMVPVRWAGNGTGAYFGWSVAVAGDRAVVGAFEDSWYSIYSGSAWVFERNTDGTWPATGTQLIPSDPAAYASFGIGVSMSGDRVLVGGGGNPHGAYVFVRQSAGVWTQEQKLLPSDGFSTDSFGSSVALEGDRALVGAVGSSSAYVFERQASGTWMQMAKLLSPVPPPVLGDHFGKSVSISGNLALVGAPYENRVIDGITYTPAGAAFLFQRQANGTWGAGLEVKPNGADLAGIGGFGNVVSLSGNFAAITPSSDLRTAPPRIATGAAYIADVRSVLP